MNERTELANRLTDVKVRMSEYFESLRQVPTLLSTPESQKEVVRQIRTMTQEYQTITREITTIWTYRTGDHEEIEDWVANTIAPISGEIAKQFAHMTQYVKQHAANYHPGLAPRVN